ncbi:MAG: hypothetical protein WDM78_19810 [Puia sp.]
MTIRKSSPGSRVSYLTNLTPMRGIAALLTVIFHIDLFTGGSLVHASASSIMNRMYLMVDFFFILSGFIMCYVYGDRFTTQVKKVDLKNLRLHGFHVYIRCIYRCCSSLFFILFLFAKLGVPKNPILQVDNNAYSVLTNLLLLHSMNFHNWFTWVHASWSISTEVGLYDFSFFSSPFF